LKVADSSFITEGLLKERRLLEKELLLTVDLAVPETVNSIWKHQWLLKDLTDGLPYVSILFGLIASGRIRIIHPGTALMERAYSLAGKTGRPTYDTVFVALALELGCELATFDRRQANLMRDNAWREK